MRYTRISTYDMTMGTFDELTGIVEKGILPTFEFNADQSRAARAKVEALLKQAGAELWIEHDMATHAKLPKAPAYVE